MGIPGNTSSEESSRQRGVPQTSQVPSHHHWGPGYSRDFSSYDDFSGFRRRSEYDYDSDSPPRGYPRPNSRNEGYPSRNFSPPGYPSYRDDYSGGGHRRREVQTQPSSYQMPVPVQNVTARPPPMQPAASQPSGSKPRLDRKYSKIADEYRSLEEVTEALAQAGLESLNLIIGIDFTKSNEWTGKQSFKGKSLHHIGEIPNPYEEAISIIGRTLSKFDEDNLIPCFGFGDAHTHDKDVFSFFPDERPCNGFPEVLSQYKQIVPRLHLSAPTSFAPIIAMAMTIVEQSGGQYHVLVIITDGQVTRSVDTELGQLSPQEQKTVESIVLASQLPLSIILVGVGDGPWDIMQEFVDNIPARSFDNFQFVNFTEIMSKNVRQTRKEIEFALASLMEVPVQYQATLELGILGRVSPKSPGSFNEPFDPMEIDPMENQPTAPPPGASSKEQCCPICLTNPKDMAFWCGHQTCRDCVPNLDNCPICRILTFSEAQRCPICLANPKDMAFGCGHQTCRVCGPNLDNCPICRMLKFSEAQHCPICLTNPKDMAFGCRHQTCRDCGPNLDNCPICRMLTFSEAQRCPICLTNPKDMAFVCGHQTCCDCGPKVDNCPICHRPIDTRIRLIL